MQQKRKVLIQLNVCLLCLLFFMLVLPMAAGTPVTDSDVRKLIAKARQATDKYHDESVAVDEGYVSTIVCIEIPGLGGMGIHYVNFSAVDLVVDELTPEILLYIETDEGFKLVGVEYVSIALADTGDGPAPWFGVTPPSLGWFTTNPTLFGRLMDGPMPGHADPETEPWHYDLHVWLWQANPEGIFEDFNPNIKC